MSKSHRKAIKLLLTMALFEENGFLSGIREKVFEIIDLYQKEGGKVTDPEYQEIINYGKICEAQLTELNYKTSEIMMFSLIMAIADYFYQKTGNGKQKKWLELHEIVRLSLSRNYDNFESEIDKASEVAEILIYNA